MFNKRATTHSKYDNYRWELSDWAWLLTCGTVDVVLTLCKRDAPRYVWKCLSNLVHHNQFLIFWNHTYILEQGLTATCYLLSNWTKTVLLLLLLLILLALLWWQVFKLRCECIQELDIRLIHLILFFNYFKNLLHKLRVLTALNHDCTQPYLVKLFYGFFRFPSHISQN